MKVFVVQNSNDIVIGVFKRRKKAKRLVKDFGKKIWNEKWDITTYELNKFGNWVYK